MAKLTQDSALLGFTWYRPEQYDAVKAFCEDGDSMEATHEIWRRGAEKAIHKLRKEGAQVERVDFDLEEFKAWCIVNAKPTNGRSRAEFTTHELRARHSS